MLLCERLDCDPVTGKINLNGIHHALNAPGFPVRPPALRLFGMVTGVRGEVSLRFQIAHVDGLGEPVISRELPVKANSPATVVFLDVDCSNAVFHRPGMYAVELLWGGELLAQTSIAVEGV